ncbi:MAG TPA: GNAT family N-acetyltransferase [Acidimicrobiales bacterium]
MVRSVWALGARRRGAGPVLAGVATRAPGRAASGDGGRGTVGRAYGRVLRIPRRPAGSGAQHRGAGRAAARARRDPVPAGCRAIAGRRRSLERLVQLHASQWGSRSGFSSAAPAFVAAATAGMGRGEVSVHELAADDEVGASLVTFELSGRWSYYQAGRRLDHRWRGAGTVLLAQVIEAAFAAGATELDLLRGDEAYKPAWATRSRDVLRVRFGVGAAGRLALSSIEALDRARAAAGRAREGIGARIR